MGANPDCGGIDSMLDAWCHRIGVLVCLLALLGAVFGHTEQTAATIAASDPVVGSASPSDAPSHHENGLLGQHCTQNTQCSVQAVLQAAAGVEPHGLDAVAPATEQLGGNQVISPLPHPPKSAERV